jgi:hypothetical protein
MVPDAAADHKTGCVVCGTELVYGGVERDIPCFYCGAQSHTSVACAAGHYVCDACHSGSANDLIQRYCTASDSLLPFDMAITLMKDRRLKMHGPEHHFLVPAVLLAAYCNASGRSRDEKAAMIVKARARAEPVVGGSCGFNGACGAGVGTGIFVSLVTGATPLSRKEWRLANLMTSESLRVIADLGGPRCCKRDTFLALQTAVAFMAREMDLAMPAEDPVRCDFSAMNRECLKEGCPYYRVRA